MNEKKSQTKPQFIPLPEEAGVFLPEKMIKESELPAVINKVNAKERKDVF